MDGEGPPDPFGDLALANAATVAMWAGLVREGMPPMVAAVYLGQWMGALGAQSSKPDEGPPQRS